MANKFVRSTRDVKDVTKLSDNVVEENDIISQTDGKVFIRKNDGTYLELGASSGGDGDLEQIKSDISKLKTDLTSTDTSVKDLTQKVTDLEAKATDFETRISKLENPTE